ncbi:MAG: hypothetical protein ACXVEF_25160 [Polyangiales bacterium]
MRRLRLIALALMACTKASVVAPSSLSVARPAAPWPSDVPMCAIDGESWDQMCAPSFDVRDEKGVVRARVERSTYTRVRWSRLPLLGGGYAWVEASAAGLRVEGHAALEGQAFTVRRSIEIAGPHARIPAGSIVSILGTAGSNVVVSVPTGFAAPAHAEVAIACGDLGRAQTESMPAGPPFAKARAKPIRLRSSVSGPTVLTFEPRANDAWVWLDRQGDFVHVRGGHFAWRKWADRTSFVFDGWVAIDDVAKVEAIDNDWDSGCDPVDLHDSCPRVWAAHDAVVRASPHGAAVGILVRSAEVVTLEKRDGFTAFHLPNEEIVPPKGTQFWIADADLQSGCSGATLDDGCPCAP